MPEPRVPGDAHAREQGDLLAAQAGGAIALTEDGDTIIIDIPGRSIHLDVDDHVLARRRARLEAGNGYRPGDRDRPVSTALRAYAAMALSADKGAVRDVTKLR